MKAVRARRSEASPNKISFDKHSSFADRTHLSAYAFRFGLRAGSGIGFIPPAFSVARNTEQNSCRDHAMRTVACPGIPKFHYWRCEPSVASMLGVIPAKLTRRLSRWMKNKM